MQRWLTLALSFSALVLSAPAVYAQPPAALRSRPVAFYRPLDTLTAAESGELDAWLAGMRRWRKMDKRWHNEPAHDPFGRIIRRASRPAAPEWLDPRCAALPPDLRSVSVSRLGEACRLLAGVEEDITTHSLRTATAAQRAGAEEAVRDSFLTRVHIDGLWTTTSTDVRLYGLIGSHISLVDIGRVQFFGPPGVLVLAVPDARGSRQIKVGYTWGMSVRLKDVRLFAPSKNLTLFLTMTKVWITGGMVDRLAPGGFDIAGFSLAPRRGEK